jgi:membrane protein implicated in regulation of membrane protease activity
MSKTPLWETVVIFLGIIALWPPYVLRLEDWYWKAFAYLMLGLLVLVLIRRLRRVKVTLEESRNGKPPV